MLSTIIITPSHKRPPWRLQPVAPPPPLRPAEQPPNPATIEFSNGVLSVHAQNSSLVNILVQIQHQTGLVIDGLSHDQRMYGQYGPGSVSATLTALLDGSGYDFIIVGGGAGGTAPKLILSTPASTAAAAAPAPVVSNEASRRQMAIRLNPRTRQLRHRQSHHRKSLMNCAECILNDGGRAGERFLYDGMCAEQRRCASDIRTVLRSRTALQQIYGLADLV